MVFPIALTSALLRIIVPFQLQQKHSKSKVKAYNICASVRCNIPAIAIANAAA